MLEQAVEIEQLFREDNGAIRIYASSTIGNYILPAVIARYRHDYPQLPIELKMCIRDRSYALARSAKIVLHPYRCKIQIHLSDKQKCV